MATTDAFDVVPETMLWNLHHRAAEARRPDTVLADPAGTVVALGDGLETQFWRVDNGRVRWLSVDLEEGAPLARGRLPRPISYLIPWTILRISFAG